MARNLNILLLFQIVLVFWTLIIISMGLVLTWAFLNLQEPKVRRRPGINIKEF